MKKISLFRYLADSQLKELLEISDVIIYMENSKIVAEGEITPFFFAILDGTVNISVTKESGKEVFLSTLGAGQTFGEAGIFVKAHRTANVISADNTTILRIRR